MQGELIFCGQVEGDGNKMMGSVGTNEFQGKEGGECVISLVSAGGVEFEWT